jgi:hypothetical protein
MWVGIIALMTVGVLCAGWSNADSVRAGAGTLLTQYPMIMSHDSASGEISEKRDFIIAKWARTQSVGLVDQLQCGARAFDYRPSSKDGTIYAHHGGVTIRVPMEESLRQVISWANSNPDDLVIFYLSHFYGDDCEKAVADLLTKNHVYAVNDCNALKSLTYGEAKAEAIKTGLGRKGAVMAIFDCTEENYDSKINCYGKNFVCYDSWPKNSSSIPFEHLSTHLQSVTSVDPTTSYAQHMWMAQAHWQSTAESVSLGTLHESSLVLDVTRSHINQWLETAVSQRAFTHLNFLEVDDVCDNGNNLYKALRTYY